MTDVEGWLRKGLGRASAFLKTNDSWPWRDNCCTHHEGVARAAMNALPHLCDPAVRELALDPVQKPEWRRVAVEMLIRNPEDGDYRLIERPLAEQLDPDDYHDLGIGVRHYVE